jgi:hydroxymethylpyrimidine/phosphomethylpyrimidine kinase
MPASAAKEPAKALTIAGSDSGGAAGLQADLKTFAALAVYGMSVVTVVTAQNSMQVASVRTMPAKFVVEQIRTVMSDYGAGAAKTGFIGRVDVIKAVTQELSRYRSTRLVVDPVLVNHKGEAMFPNLVTEAYVRHLFPLAYLVTPNQHEAGLLVGRPLTNLEETQDAAVAICAQGSTWTLVTGCQEGDDIVDVLSNGRKTNVFRSRRVDTENTHGSGDTLSAAVCAYIAKGLELEMAVERAREFTRTSIRRAVGWRLGGGHGPLNYWHSDRPASRDQ